MAGILFACVLFYIPFKICRLLRRSFCGMLQVTYRMSF